MSDKRIENIHIFSEDPLLSPLDLRTRLPQTEQTIQTVMHAQRTIKNIIDRKDHRLLLVVGPCSIHDIKSAKEYARKLKKLAEDVKESLFIVMRVYFEKPRTRTGWKGLIYDPYLDNSCLIADGLKLARELLLDIAMIGLPVAGEALDMISPQYVQDLISWTAIGARTTESQTHRNMSSGFSSAVGFKNGTSGDLSVAINAIHAAASANNFLSVNPQGEVAIIRTKGNPYAHIVLRGGVNQKNYDQESIQFCEKEHENAGLTPSIVVDCSHGNSDKDPKQQIPVLEDVARQILAGNQSIIGLMIESHLKFGNQPIPQNLKELKYGVSITDACLDWESTEDAVKMLSIQLKDLLPLRI
jgi:3-deoxy-7-phosphoheptulonate synthase